MWKSRYSALRLAALYATVAFIWIMVSDALVNTLPPRLAAVLQSAKGSLFVVVSAVAFYVVVERATEYTRREIASATIVERMLGQVLDSAPVGIMLAADDGTVTFINSEAQTMVGLDDSEAVGRRMEDVLAPEPTVATAALGVALRTGDPQEVEIGGRRQDARVVMVQASAVNPEVQTSGWVLTLYDVTDAHRQVVKSNEAVARYRFFAKCLQVCARASDERLLLESIATAGVETGRYKAAWALGPGHSGESYEQVAVSGLGSRALEVADAVVSAVQAMTKEPGFEATDSVTLSNNLAADPANNWHPAAEEESLGASAELTLTSVDRLIGRVTFFADSPGAFDSDERRVLEELLVEMSLAVSKIHLDRSRENAERVAGAGQEDYRRLFEQHPAPMWVYDLETLEFLDVNEAAVSKYGFSREEFIGMSVAKIRPGDEMTRLESRVEAGPHGFEDVGIWTHKDHSGREFPVHVYSHTSEWEGRPAEVVMVLEVARME